MRPFISSILCLLLIKVAASAQETVVVSVPTRYQGWNELKNDQDRFIWIDKIEKDRELSARDQFQLILRIALSLQGKGPFIWEQMSSSPNWDNGITIFTGTYCPDRPFLKKWFDCGANRKLHDYIFQLGYYSMDEFTPAKGHFSEKDRTSILAFAVKLYDDASIGEKMPTSPGEGDLAKELPILKSDRDRSQAIGNIERRADVSRRNKFQHVIELSLEMEETESPVTGVFAERVPNWAISLAHVLSNEPLNWATKGPWSYLGVWRQRGCGSKLSQKLMEMGYLKADGKTPLKSQFKPEDKRTVLEFALHLFDNVDKEGDSIQSLREFEQTDLSGHIYMQARFYLPMYGRFLRPDPARDQHFEDTQSWNIYSYCQNNLITNIDPTGEVLVSSIGDSKRLLPILDKLANGASVSCDSKSMQYAVAGDLSGAGAKLLSRVISNEHEARVEFGNMNSEVEAGDGNSQVTVTGDPLNMTVGNRGPAADSLMTTGVKTDLKVEEAPAEIVLGHELIRSVQTMTGDNSGTLEVRTKTRDSKERGPDRQGNSTREYRTS